jgi:formylglycine-generating enzyme required for sulfatase activity
MQKWFGEASDSKPKVTDDIKLFLSESAKEEVRLSAIRNRTIFFVSTLVLLTTLVGTAWWFQDVLREEIYWGFVMKPSVPPKSREADFLSQPSKTFADCRNGCPRLVIIPPGTFKMGSTEARFPRERPQRQVYIRRPFAMAEHELTFDEWDHCVAMGHCRGDVATNGWGRGTQPVTNVTWGDAKQYVAWLSQITGRRYRLPSEAEWEYAARAGSADYFSFGNDDKELDKYGWYGENSGNRAQPVAMKLPNKFGLYDMHGNVSEWTEDCANDNYNQAPNDGSPWMTGQCDTRAFRGGSWLHGPRVARSANRDWLLGDDRKDYIGFRVVRELE